MPPCSSSSSASPSGAIGLASFCCWSAPPDSLSGKTWIGGGIGSGQPIPECIPTTRCSRRGCTRPSTRAFVTTSTTACPRTSVSTKSGGEAWCATGFRRSTCLPSPTHVGPGTWTMTTSCSASRSTGRNVHTPSASWPGTRCSRTPSVASTSQACTAPSVVR